MTPGFPYLSASLVHILLYETENAFLTFLPCIDLPSLAQPLQDFELLFFQILCCTFLILNFHLMLTAVSFHKIPPNECKSLRKLIYTQICSAVHFAR